jgi:predicted aldo/keto reductase-like oxidoreductase
MMERLNCFSHSAKMSYYPKSQVFAFSLIIMGKAIDQSKGDHMERELKQFIDQTMAKGATYVDARWYPFEESNSLVIGMKP